MNINRLSFILFSFFWLITSLTFLAQNDKEINFERISIEDGLSESTTFAITQDSLGFMWFGTNDGLNKYDGYKFTAFKPEPGNLSSISGNRIFKLFVDSEGVLWIGTDNGLNRYNQKTNTFERFNFCPDDTSTLSNNYISEIFEDSRGNFWIGTNNGLNLLDRKTGLSTRYMADPQNKSAIIENHIWTIFEDSQHRLWLGTDRGINRYIYESNNFERYYIKNNGKIDFLENTIFKIYEDKDKNLWVGTREGLHLFYPEKDKFVTFRNSPENPNSISYDNIWSVFQDSRSNFWIATLGGGLNIMSSRGKFISYKHNLRNQLSLSSNYVWSIYEDKAGILWIGTDIGINKLDPGKEKFNLIQNKPYDNNSLVNNEVHAVLSDRKGILWIGTRAGLNSYNPETGKFILYKNSPAEKYSISNDYIRSIFEDSKGNLWIGTNGGGLNKFSDGKFFHFVNDPSNPKTLSENKVLAITEDKFGHLWIATLNGINEFAPISGEFNKFVNKQGDTNSISHDYVTTLKFDEDGLLWVGTYNGLNLFNPKTKKFTYFSAEGKYGDSGLSTNYIWSLYISGDSVWVGTNGGLTLFDKKQNLFSKLDPSLNLFNSVVYGILDDREGNLWLSSNKGIYKFNPAARKIKNYTVGDGLQSNQFSGGAFSKDNNGKLYFGGINGLNSFFPDNISENTHLPPIVITDLKILNKSAEISKEGPLTSSISTADKIELSYYQDVFSFEFASLDYSFPSENEFKYKLDNFDSDWNYSGTRNFVMYTNLDAGEYIFHVIGSNNDGVWNPTGTQLQVVIHPPFWETWWFILMVSGALTLLVYLVISYRVKSILEIERLRTRIAADLHDDVGTKLTEISMLSDIIYHTEGKSDLKMINNIGHIARSLIDSMDDIIWLVNPKRDTLYELFLKLRDTYEELLSRSNIMIEIKNLHILEKIRLPMEKRKNLYLIFKEALNNSVKHSECTEIVIDTKLEGKNLRIILKDNGKGFSTENLRKGNGLDNMKHRADLIKGKLTINSEKHKGTTIDFIGKI